MRRASLATFVALVLSAAVLSGTAGAKNPVELRYYQGTTADGAVVRIGVAESSSGVVRLGLLLVNHAPYSCEDGTEGTTGTGVGWVPAVPVIEDDHLDLSENWGSIAFSVAGRIGVHRGSGTLTFVMASLTAGEQAQVCTIGELAWTVERIAADQGFPFARPAGVQRLSKGRRVLVGLDAIGSRAATTAVARASTAPVRHYDGITSAGHGMKTFTQRVNRGVEVLRLAFGYELACDDGSTFEGRWVNFPIPSATVMPLGRFDVDVLEVVEPSVALHVHGELDPHAGAGTLAYVSPQLTQDLQAQLCVSGELTWELWRTDSGY